MYFKTTLMFGHIKAFPTLTYLSTSKQFPSFLFKYFKSQFV